MPERPILGGCLPTLHHRGPMRHSSRRDLKYEGKPPSTSSGRKMSEACSLLDAHFSVYCTLAVLTKSLKDSRLIYVYAVPLPIMREARCLLHSTRKRSVFEIRSFRRHGMVPLFEHRAFTSFHMGRNCVPVRWFLSSEPLLSETRSGGGRDMDLTRNSDISQTPPRLEDMIALQNRDISQPRTQRQQVYEELMRWRHFNMSDVEIS
nr:hypothetical protein CFP56_03956 [Quercus suber]